MRDTKLIDQDLPRLPDEWRQKYLQRSLERLPEDVTKAYDRIWDLQREKDEINGRLIAAEKALGWANLKIWILGGLVVGEGAIIGWLAKELIVVMARLR